MAGSPVSVGSSVGERDARSGARRGASPALRLSGRPRGAVARPSSSRRSPGGVAGVVRGSRRRGPPARRRMTRWSERLGELARAVRALPGWVLRRAGPVEPLSRRSWLLDVGLALGLALIAILSYDGDATTPRFVPREVPGGVGPLPPEDCRPSLRWRRSGRRRSCSSRRSGWGWAGHALLLAADRGAAGLPPSLSALDAVGRAGHRPRWSRSDPGPLRLSFYVCVIAAYSAAVYSPYRGPALASLPAAAFLLQELQQRRGRTGARRGDQRGAAGRGPVPDHGADRGRRVGPASLAGPRRRRTGPGGGAGTGERRSGPPRRGGGTRPDRAGAARRRDP